MQNRILLSFLGLLLPAFLHGQTLTPELTSPAAQSLSRTTTAIGLPAVEKVFFHLNGYTIHFDKRPDPGETVNDYLIGIGGSVEFATEGTFLYGATFDIFNDSNQEIAVVLGPTMAYPFSERFQVGAALLLFYKESFQRDNGFPLLLTPLPYADVRLFANAHLRAYYIPPVRKSTDHQLSFQFRFSF